MRTILVTVCILATCLARPQSPNDAIITKYANENNGSGPYKFSYETSDGQFREEEGKILNPGSDNEILVVRGSYGYLGPDGVMYKVNYVADEEGFKPEGAHIPGSPKKLPPATLPPGVLGSLIGGGIG